MTSFNKSLHYAVQSIKTTMCYAVPILRSTAVASQTETLKRRDKSQHKTLRVFMKMKLPSKKHKI